MPTPAIPPTVTSTVKLSIKHRLAISAGRSDPDDELATLARARKLPLRALAKRARVGWTLFQLARQGKRAMPTLAARRIEALTGYEMRRWARLSE